MSLSGESRLAHRLASLVLAALVLAILAAIAQGFDGRVATWAVTLPDDARAWGSMLSRLGQSGYLFAISAGVAIGAIALRARARAAVTQAALALVAERAVFLFGVVAVTGGVTQAAKQVVGRGRPPLLEKFGAFDFSSFSFTNAHASFPSGHSSTSFAMATALSLLAPSLRVPLLVLAGAIAASRIVVQAHYPSDIVAGGALGVALALLTARLFAGFDVAFAWREDRLVLRGSGIVAASLPG